MRPIRCEFCDGSGWEHDIVLDGSKATVKACRLFCKKKVSQVKAQHEADTTAMFLRIAKPAK